MTTENITEVDGDNGKIVRERYWYVVEDDTPIFPERPLTAGEATRLFLRVVADDSDAKVAIEQCDQESLEWAGVDDGRGRDEDDRP